MGKLVKGGEAAALSEVLCSSLESWLSLSREDLDTAARIVLYDWQRGRIPYFTPPPQREGEEEVRSSPGSPSSL